ncbi:MAG: cation:proton antiporter [Myxococcales bacterium]|nr:cation:proton antiporter [Myxococcales bacterium]
MKLVTCAGVVLLAAALLGEIARRLRVPSVLGYLGAGVLLGPSGLAADPTRLPALLRPLLLTPSAITSLAPISALAQALILFAVGRRLKLSNLRSGGGALAAHAISDIVLTFALATSACLVVLGSEHYSLAMLFGAVAIATAPAATLLVLREAGAGEAIKARILPLVGLDNTASLVAFVGLLGAAFALPRPYALLLDIGRGALVGLAFGLLLLVPLRLAGTEQKKLLVGLGGLLGCWGAAQLLGTAPLAATLIYGAALANLGGDCGDKVAASLARLDYPILVLFFALAGAHLHLDLFTASGNAAALALTIAYVLGRGAGKALSTPLAALLHARVDERLGLGMLAQAGLAISLVDVATAVAATSGRPELVAQAALLRAVVLAAVAFFELVGPLALRRVVDRRVASPVQEIVG